MKFLPRKSIALVKSVPRESAFPKMAEKVKIVTTVVICMKVLDIVERRMESLSRRRIIEVNEKEEEEIEGGFTETVYSL
ncbi:hypothetical protein WUBG_03774 [Wuchereria bancrofti]|uniref:Uncharacterized protein n=1 Tax=Wuchereria bancrofti TaxID=6293 RepID=J9FD73_WUCBA|nr:hypothetical protein WUBG_03774 [Wuchereria bancrofti]VDM19919.1 unnamed protein product [Wuchereria bancrofti]